MCQCRWLDDHPFVGGEVLASSLKRAFVVLLRSSSVPVVYGITLSQPCAVFFLAWSANAAEVEYKIVEHIAQTKERTNFRFVSSDIQFYIGRSCCFGSL